MLNDVYITFSCLFCRPNGRLGSRLEIDKKYHWSIIGNNSNCLNWDISIDLVWKSGYIYTLIKSFCAIIFSQIFAIVFLIDYKVIPHHPNSLRYFGSVLDLVYLLCISFTDWSIDLDLFLTPVIFNVGRSVADIIYDDCLRKSWK